MSDDDSRPVTVTEDGEILVIQIDRPEARNAIDRAVAEAIRDAADRLDAADHLRVGILTGAGGTFCSGMDLKAYLRGEVPVFPGRGLCGITETPPRKPLIAAVEGWALAGGFELMLACDLVVAGRGARFGLPEVKRGLVAGAGGAMLLADRVPPAVAMEILLTGEPVDAARAAAHGLVNAVVEDGGALAEAVRLARVIAANAPLAVAASKSVARQARDWPPAERWRRHDALLAPVFASADAVEGARAFAEKRAPVWTGHM